jgi:hypothetical protein
MDFPIVNGFHRDIPALGGCLPIHQSARNGTHEQQKQSVRYRLQPNLG